MANRKPMPRHQPERPGIVLLLSLIMMSAVMASTIAISIAITRTLAQSRNLDSFIVASLASDSGIERGLAAVRIGRKTGKTFAQSLSAAAIATPTNLAASDAAFTVASSETNDDFLLTELKEDQVATFDVLKTTTDPANYLVVQAECPGACTSLLEVTWVLIDSTGNASLSNRKILTNNFTLPYTGGGTNISLQDVRSDTSDAPDTFASGTILGYRVRLRALNGDLENVQATPCTVSGVTVNFGCPSGQDRPLLGRVVLDSIGEAGASNERARSRKQAAVFWQPQAAGLLNYVLFSEESIIP